METISFFKKNDNFINLFIFLREQGLLIVDKGEGRTSDFQGVELFHLVSGGESCHSLPIAVCLFGTFIYSQGYLVHLTKERTDALWHPLNV